MKYFKQLQQSNPNFPWIDSASLDSIRTLFNRTSRIPVALRTQQEQDDLSELRVFAALRPKSNEPNNFYTLLAELPIQDLSTPNELDNAVYGVALWTEYFYSQFSCEDHLIDLLHSLDAHLDSPIQFAALIRYLLGNQALRWSGVYLDAMHIDHSLNAWMTIATQDLSKFSVRFFSNVLIIFMLYLVIEHGSPGFVQYSFIILGVLALLGVNQTWIDDDWNRSSLLIESGLLHRYFARNAYAMKQIEVLFELLSASQSIQKITAVDELLRLLDNYSCNQDAYPMHTLKGKMSESTTLIRFTPDIRGFETVASLDNWKRLSELFGDAYYAQILKHIDNLDRAFFTEQFCSMPSTEICGLYSYIMMHESAEDRGVLSKNLAAIINDEQALALLHASPSFFWIAIVEKRLLLPQLDSQQVREWVTNLSIEYYDLDAILALLQQPFFWPELTAHTVILHQKLFDFSIEHITLIKTALISQIENQLIEFEPAQVWCLQQYDKSMRTFESDIEKHANSVVTKGMTDVMDCYDRQRAVWQFLNTIHPEQCTGYPATKYSVQARVFTALKSAEKIDAAVKTMNQHYLQYGVRDYDVAICRSLLESLAENNSPELQAILITLLRKKDFNQITISLLNGTFLFIDQAIIECNEGLLSYFFPPDVDADQIRERLRMVNHRLQSQGKGSLLAQSMLNSQVSLDHFERLLSLYPPEDRFLAITTQRVSDNRLMWGIICEKYDFASWSKLLPLFPETKILSEQLIKIYFPDSNRVIPIVLELVNKNPLLYLGLLFQFQTQLVTQQALFKKQSWFWSSYQERLGLSLNIKALTWMLNVLTGKTQCIEEGVRYKESLQKLLLKIRDNAVCSIILSNTVASSLRVS